MKIPRSRAARYLIVKSYYFHIRSLTPQQAARNALAIRFNKRNYARNLHNQFSPSFANNENNLLRSLPSSYYSLRIFHILFILFSSSFDILFIFHIMWKRTILPGKGYVMVRNIISRAMFKCCICGQAIAFGLRCFQSLDKATDHYHTSCYDKSAVNNSEHRYHEGKRSFRYARLFMRSEEGPNKPR